MGELSKIEWTDHTFNIWEGCDKISPGCKNCYAWRRDKWLHNGQHWGPGSLRLFHKAKYWDQLREWNKKAAAERIRRRVFCGSLMDILEHRPELIEERNRYFSLVNETPWLIHLFLTKRPENWELFPSAWKMQWPRNAMFGFTAENQPYLDERMRHVKSAASRFPDMRVFVSAEPLLGELNFRPHLRLIDWGISGGESGEYARPSAAAWHQSIANQFQLCGKPFMFKQWGNYAPINGLNANDPEYQGGRSYKPWDGGTASLEHGLDTGAVTRIVNQNTVVELMERFPASKKHDAGRTLNGKVYDGIPLWHQSEAPPLI